MRAQHEAEARHARPAGAQALRPRLLNRLRAQTLPQAPRRRRLRQRRRRAHFTRRAASRATRRPRR